MSTSIMSDICSIIILFLPLMPYFGAGGSFLGFINSINYVWSFAVAFILYLILMKTGLAGNSFVTEEEHEAFTKRS